MSQDGQNGYIFSVFSDGRYDLSLLKDRKWSQLVAAARSPIIRANDANTLKVVQTVTDADGDTATSSIDLSAGVFSIQDSGPQFVDTYPGIQWNLGDFILWHGYREGDSLYWDTVIGRGRPSWNIQDPSMVASHFRETLSIYCGGIDNLYRHHDYSIAILESLKRKLIFVEQADLFGEIFLTKRQEAASHVPTIQELENDFA